MSKFDILYKSLLKQNKLNITVEQSEEDISSPAVPQQKKPVEQKSSGNSTFDFLTKNILPILLGLGSVSMLFGQGIFGLGKKQLGSHGLFGGWFGGSIGALGTLAFLPGLWSNKSVTERFKSAFDKFSKKQIWEGILQLLGISSSADQVLKAGESDSKKLQSTEAGIQARRENYIKYGTNVANIKKWMTNNKYNPGETCILTENICCFSVNTQTQAEKKAVGSDQGLCFLISSSKGIHAVLCNLQQASSLLNYYMLEQLKQGFTVGCDETRKNIINTNGNPARSKTDGNDEEGLAAIANLYNPTTINEWLKSIVYINQKIKSGGPNGLKFSYKLFENLNQIQAKGFIIDIPENINLVEEQTESSTQELADTFSKDESLKNMKDDPILNKFDKGIQKIQNQISDIYLKALLDSIQAANEKDPTAFIIECQNGSETLYYARKPEQNYLTKDFEQTIYFSKQEVQKLEGSGDLVKKLENTLQKIHLPQVMKMKNPGIKVVIKSINIEYSKKVGQVLKNKFKIDLEGLV